MKDQDAWRRIAEYVRFTPSPHNTQPIRIKILSTNKAELYYDLSRALPEGDPPARFAYTAIGLFTESCKIAAASMGYKLTWDYTVKELQNTKKLGMQKVANIELTPDNDISDLPVGLLAKRKTNRLEYDGRKPNKIAINEIQAEVEKYGHHFYVRYDAPAVEWVTGLNKRMVFYDLDEANVRQELAIWSRFTKKQAHNTKDGLSAECLNVPGWGLWLFMKHYGFMHVPGVRQLLQKMYWKNMQGIPAVAWLEGPFKDTEDYLLSGHVLMRVWLIMAKNGIAYHPFGSIITNQRAHEEFRDFMNINESKNMAWLLMRVGYSSQEPPRSERLPLEEILI